MKFDTKVVHAGIRPDPTTGSIVPPIYQTATYVLEEVGRDKGFDYTRSSNPTRQVLEENLAALDSGRYGVMFASGMAAVDGALKLLEAGDHVVCSDDVYGGVSRHFNRVLASHGLGFTYVDSARPETVRQAIRPETKMLWIETPSNPLLKITDIEAMSAIAKEAGIWLAVDSTFATPVYLRPLELGADIVMHSTTKYLSGHNQIIGGVLVTDREEIFDRFKFIQKTIGAVPSPFDCWLTLLGVKTLHLRMPRHSENAQAVRGVPGTARQGRARHVPRTRLASPACARQRSDVRLQRDDEVRAPRRRRGGPRGDERGEACGSRGKPRCGGDDDHPPRHHDPCRRPGRGAPGARAHRRAGPALGRHRGRGRHHRRPGAGAARGRDTCAGRRCAGRDRTDSSIVREGRRGTR